MDREQLYAPAPAYELESSASESDDSDDDGEHRHFAAYGLRAKRAGAGASSLGRAARYGELNVRIGSVGSATGQGDAGELLVLVGDAGERFSRFVRPGAVLEGQGQQVELVRPGVDNEESMQLGELHPATSDTPALALVTAQVPLASSWAVSHALISHASYTSVTVIASYSPAAYLSSASQAGDDDSAWRVRVIENDALKSARTSLQGTAPTFEEPNLLHGLAAAVLVSATMAQVPARALMLPSRAQSGPLPAASLNALPGDVVCLADEEDEDDEREVARQVATIAHQLGWQDWCASQDKKGSRQQRQGFGWLDKLRRQSQVSRASSMYM